MPIGSFAWQRQMYEFSEGSKRSFLQWRFTVDEGPQTFRHSDFAIPVKPSRYKSFFEVGEYGSSKLFSKTGSLYHGPRLDYIRELLDSNDVKSFDTDALWFFSKDQTPQDSVPFDPSLSYP
uniref:Uncharacterized protein n=1 Tax=Panagrolaimus superbus TaxID=310955 RepID=A0A914YNB7_9BILA